MREKLPGMPGIGAHIISAVWAILLVICLTLTAVTGLLDETLLDAGLHQAIAADDAVVDAQMARIEQDVTALADKYHFDGDAVMALITRESVVQYGRDATAWWMGLIAPGAELIAPAWGCDALEETIREDALFQESTPTGQQKSIARDKAAAGVVSAVNSAVLPIRTQLITMALSKVSAYGRITAYAAYLPYLPAALGLMSLVLCGLICLSMSRRLVKALLYIGAGSAGAALGLGGVLLAIKLLNLPQAVTEVSPLLGMQIDLLMGRLGLWGCMMAGALLMVGLGMIGLHQRSMFRLRSSLAKVDMEV